MIINDVHQGIHKRIKRRRVGRGPGSGYGKTASRGHKGEGSRNGASVPLSFQGGQTPLFRRTAKRGFNNKAFAEVVFAVNVYQLEEHFENGDLVNVQTLAAKGIAKSKFDQLKILGNGYLTKKLTVQAHKYSASAEEKIKQAGGTIEFVSISVPVETKTQ